MFRVLGVPCHSIFVIAFEDYPTTVPPCLRLLPPSANSLMCALCQWVWMPGKRVRDDPIARYNRATKSSPTCRQWTPDQPPPCKALPSPPPRNTVDKPWGAASLALVADAIKPRGMSENPE